MLTSQNRFDSSWACIGQLPAYLAALKYKNPDAPENTLSHHATGTDFFAYLRHDPVRLARFNSAMKGAGQLVASPVPSSLLQQDEDGSTGASASASVSTSPSDDDEHANVVMVDVGGGVGQVTEKVMEENPQVKGRFVLQDLGPIVEQARAKSPKYQVMEYDFFTPQPVHGESRPSRTFLSLPPYHTNLNIILIGKSGKN